MKLGFNAMVLHGRYTGVHQAGWELLQSLAELDGVEHVNVYAGRKFDTGDWSPPNVNISRRWFSSGWRTARIIYEQLCLARRAVRDGCEVLHCPAYIMPLFCNLIPTVVTIHDVIALSHPELCTKSNVQHYKRFLPKTVERASRIIVPSQATKKALFKQFKGVGKKVRVVPFGVAERFRPVTDAAALADIRERYGLPERYVLYVGRHEPKKNLPGLIKAFFAAVMAGRHPHSLVLAGPDGPRMQPINRLIRELAIADRIVRIPYVPDEDLPGLYSAAECCALVSRIEGFGFPALEAMACGTPVVISHDKALREIAGKPTQSAAWDDIAGLRMAFESIMNDPKLRDDLKDAGLERAKEFTWKACAEKTCAVLAEALDEYDRIGA